MATAENDNNTSDGGKRQRRCGNSNGDRENGDIDDATATVMT